nr:transposase [Caldimonas manganoxidans]
MRSFCRADEVAGRCRVLGASVALSEAEVHWRALLGGLSRRGRSGVELILSDDPVGRKARLWAVARDALGYVGAQMGHEP